MESIRCGCGADNEPTQRFCGACGTALSRRCAACGADNPAGFRFCGGCGAALAPGSIPAPAAPARLPEERRWVTVVFADLSGFTRLSESMDPEDVRSLVDRSMTLMGDVVGRYGGYVEGVIGDQLLALFGAPVAHEDDPERAVRTALDLQRCAADHPDEFGGLGLRVGVNTGEVMFAPVGPEGARHQTVMGDVANTASRLQTAAAVGGILVGEETWRATRHAIRYEAVAPFAAKGKEAPLSAWRALEAKAATSPRRPSSAVPMVGREAELEMLWGIWERVVAEGRPYLVTVLGAPGIGKTRLAREFIGRAEGEGARCLHGRSLPYGERTGYGAFAQQVKGLAGIFDTDPVPDVRAKLVAACGVLPADDARQVASHLAVLLGLDSGEIVPDKAALLFSARRFVEAVAGETPTIFVFEDVHWSDPSLLDLVESLASRSRTSPTLLFTLARPELLDARPAWGGGLSRYTALALDPLPAEAAQALAARLAPHVTDLVTARLGEVAGGNPLFIEELAASVSDTTAGLLSDLPTNVKATIAARLDALPAGERQTILDASVVGKIFWRGALEHQGAGRDVADLLDSLERRDFIRREPSSRFQGDAEFSFKHMLIREVAYATLPKAARRERHAAVARFLEDAAGDRLAESASLLAHHWLEGGDTARARDYLVQAAERARRAWASGEAVRLYDEALQLVDAADTSTHRRLRLARGFALFDAGDLAGVAVELDDLLPELAGRDRSDALFLRAQTAFWTSESDSLCRLGEELAGQTTDAGDGQYQRLADLVLAEHRMLSGALDESIALGERALRSWPADERPAERAAMLGTVGLVSYWTGAFGRSVEANDAGWRLGREVDSVTSFLYTGPQLGLALAGLGRHEEAVAHLESVLAQARELELVPRLTSRCLGIFSGVLYELHQTERARRLSEEAIDCSLRAAFPNARIMAKMDLLQVDMDDGELGRAEVAWPALWEEAGVLKGWHEWLARGRLSVIRANLRLALGDAGEAARIAEAALTHWRSHRRPKYEAAAQAVLGRAELALGRPADGIRRLETAVGIAERLGHPPSFWRTASQLAAALAAAGDDDRAAAVGQQVAAAVEKFAAGLSEGHRGRFLAAGPVQGALAPNG